MLLQQFFQLFLQVFLYDDFRILQCFFQGYCSYTSKIDFSKNRFFVHRLTDSPAVSFLLREHRFFTVFITLVIIGSLVNDTQVLLEAHDNILQCLIDILGKGVPRLFDKPAIVTLIVHFLLVAQQALQVMTGNLGILTCRFIIEVIHDIAISASDYNRVHCMVAVIDTLFAETFL